MNNISKGIISLSDDLVITSGYTFDQFQSTRYYKGQNPERAFWLEEKFMLQGHTFMAGLFFRNGVIYMLSLLCCDLEFGMEEEKKRKELHDKILQSWGIGKSCSLGGLGGLIRNGAMLNRCMMPDRISAIFM